MSAPEEPTTSDTGDCAPPGIPGISRWREVYAIVFLHFVLWAFLLISLTRRFA